MAIRLPSGATVAIASAYGTSAAISALSNASTAVATAGTGVGTAGEIIELTSGWDRANGRLFRIQSVSGGTAYALEGFDSSGTGDYPAGSGTGSMRKVSTWTSVTQVQSVASSGGDIQFVDITSLSDFTQKQIPNTRSPSQIGFTVFDDPTLTYFSTVRGVSESRAPAALRVVLPGGSPFYANGYWSLQSVPNLTSGQAITLNLDFSTLAEPTRYAS
jgi:hypothetical protein